MDAEGAHDRSTAPPAAGVAVTAPGASGACSPVIGTVTGESPWAEISRVPLNGPA